MKFNKIGIGLGILWSLTILDYAISSRTTFHVYSLALFVTGFLIGNDLIFYYWAKERKEREDEKRQKHPL
jgi:hypothetical protein